MIKSMTGFGRGKYGCEGRQYTVDIKSVHHKYSDISVKLPRTLLNFEEIFRKRIAEKISRGKIVDENRLVQEIVFFSDKSSIEEELTRLKSHINQFKEFIKGESPIGKKLDFLVQEMNREINTIGSKANCLEITNRVIKLKTEVENIREQIQNIE